MDSSTSKRFVALDGLTSIAEGEPRLVAFAAAAYLTAKPDAALLILDLSTGSAVDLDLRGTPSEVVARLRGADNPSDPTDLPEEPVRGRPKLGVIAREVTLLPRHWEWLAQQRSGASAALRRLVDEARQRTAEADSTRRRQEVAYRAMTTLAGDLPGYESAIRALFASDRPAFQAATAEWPTDIRRICTSLWPTQDEDKQGTTP